MRRIAALVILVAAALAAMAPAAFAVSAAPASPGSPGSPGSPALFAHAALASTQPADGTVVATAPRQVTASFDEPVGITADSLVVYSPDGQRADDGQATLVSSYEIAVGLLPGLGDGTYTAVWHVISADTHPVTGAFTFSVGAPSATHVGALSSSSGDALVSDLFGAVRWVEYLCFALLAGGVAFLIVCWPQGGAVRGVGRLVTLSALGLLLSTLLGLLLQGPYSAGTGLSQLLSGTLVRTTLHGRLGPASEARELMSLLAVAAASFLLPRLPDAGPGFRRAAAVGWAVLTTAIAASWAVSDHASTGVQAPWGIPADIVHLDAVAVWIGGLAVLAGFALRSPGTPAVMRAVPRFSAIALGCVTVIVASGVYQAWREVGTWGALFETGYGRLIQVKIAGLLVLIDLGYLARRHIRRGRFPGEAWEQSMRRLRRSVAAELAVAAVILACTAVLVNTATGRDTYAPAVSASQAFETGGPGGTGTVHVFATPAKLGPNSIQVYLTTAGGRAFVPAQITAALYFPARNLGPLPVTLIRTAPGQYRTDSAAVTFTGQWTLQIVVRSDAFDETSVTFPLAIH
ncbi:copper resistance protein CopC [Trebonia kvetii]|uniref:Copper resistance protein CopC n=1 Tax=Trebonia kvetii TaxID=2480626 RepID=A0A6P2BX11_9ACTN|nr:copper resistance protein CopC [Trebonia kvetii]TVZ03478.1 copper resistance protein CopC [Trebonia kvetii]